ncbi:MAG: hypothetical protein C0596_11715 [Marinilabiliales bacterium]|nr:MAG: hypothetical protein C0596_11715 [Marinilabiliales bacterium]
MFSAITLLIAFQLFSIMTFSQSLQDTVRIDTTDMSMYRELDLMPEYQYFKNTNVSIRPPKYFIEFSSNEASGFLSTGTAANIVGFEYDQVPYLGYYENIADSAFSVVDNARFITSEKGVTQEGYKAQYFFYSFVIDDVDIIRIMFVTGDDKRMIYMQANYPAGFDALLRPVIVQSLLSVKF